MIATGTRLGPYEILGPLGAGGMGEVYRAHDSRLGRDVAVKVLPSHLSATPVARARFEREARTISQLNHAHICTLYDVGHQDGIDYLVMELLDGETLAHRLEKGPMPVPEALSIGRQIAEALERAHRAGVAHRDLKPGNVMLTKAGAKLMDFGLARTHAMGPAPGAMTQSPTETRPLTAEGTIVGTFQYMAPEQLEGKDADARSDLWALGCVLYEMATGQRAFAGESQASLIAAIMTGEPRAMTELRPMAPPALDRVVRRCLQKDPDARFQNASDLAFDLEGVSGSSSGAIAVAAGQSVSARKRFGWGIVLAIAVVSVLATAVVISLLPARGNRHSDPSRLTYTQLTIQRGIVAGARFSPDGKTVFYSAAWEGRPPEVFETRPGFPTSRALGLAATHLLSISGDGRMAVLLDQDRANKTLGTLAEVPISGGAPRLLLGEVWAADWSTGARSLAIAHRVGGKTRLELPPGRVLHETDGYMGFVRVSRGGAYVAIVENPVPDDTRGTVAILDTTGRVLVRTAQEWNFLTDVAWTPDDREVWFSASKDLAMTEIRALSPGGGERIVARFPGAMFLEDVGRSGEVLLTGYSGQGGIRGRSCQREEERELGWFDGSWVTDISPDGRKLLFSETGIFGGNLYAVCLRGMDGSPPVRLGEGFACSLSPDGRWALAIHFGPPHRLLRLPTGAGDSTALPRGKIDKYYGAGWLPDGKSVVFAGSEARRGRRTYVQDLVGGQPRAISQEGITGWKVSPDGRFIAALSPDQRLYVCPTNGDSARPVSQLLPTEHIVRWAADGRSLYVERGGAELSVSKIDLEAGTRSPWRTYRLPDPAGAAFNNSVLTPDARSYAYTYGRTSTVLHTAEGLK